MLYKASQSRRPRLEISPLLKASKLACYSFMHFVQTVSERDKVIWW